MLIFKLYKKEFILSSLFICLFLWASFMSILIFNQKNEILVITKDRGFFEVLKKEKETNLEVQNFLRHFIGLSLNFDKNSYDKNISKAGDMMSDALWNKQRKDFIKTSFYIKENQIIQTTQIIEVKEITDRTYEIKVENIKFKKGKTDKSFKKLVIHLSNNQRNYKNPWRYYVSDIKVK